MFATEQNIGSCMLRMGKKQKCGDIGVSFLWRDEKSSGNCMTHIGRWGESSYPARKAPVITPERFWGVTVLGTPSTTENCCFITLFGWGCVKIGSLYVAQVVLELSV